MKDNESTPTSTTFPTPVFDFTFFKSRLVARAPEFDAINKAGEKFRQVQEEDRDLKEAVCEIADNIRGNALSDMLIESLCETLEEQSLRGTLPPPAEDREARDTFLDMIVTQLAGQVAAEINKTVGAAEDHEARDIFLDMIVTQLAGRQGAADIHKTVGAAAVQRSNNAQSLS